MSNVKLVNVKKKFGDITVVNDFNALVKDGSFVSLLGPSGCGKTTVLRMIAGFEKTSEGNIDIGDRTVSSDRVFIPPEKRDIGMVFQSYAVWPHMNVFDNIAYPLKIKKTANNVIKEKVEKVLKIVHLSQYADRLPSQLSGGQQQRVALGRALVAEPGLLLLDEPLSNLDAKLRESMRFEIKEIQSILGITVIYVTHDQTEAMAMSDEIIVMNNGIIQQIGPPAEIYNNPSNKFVADFIGKVNFIEGFVKDGFVELPVFGTKMPYDGELTGEVEVGIRPENFIVSNEKGNFEGIILTSFYLGDSADFQVKVGNKIIRVIAEPKWSTILEKDMKVYLTIDHMMVFPKDGSDDHLRIST